MQTAARRPLSIDRCCFCRSKFGQLFRDAAEKTQAQVKHDSFDLSVIEIRAEDLRFVYDYLSINQR
jgi:hypothetical protein